MTFNDFMKQSVTYKRLVERDESKRRTRNGKTKCDEEGRKNLNSQCQTCQHVVYSSADCLDICMVGNDQFLLKKENARYKDFLLEKGETCPLWEKWDRSIEW